MKKHLLAVTTSLFALPLLASAQTMQKLLTTIPTFLNSVVLPFLFGIAFLIFVINVIRFFVFAGNNEDGQKKAKALIIYSIAAFVFLVIFAGAVNLLSSSLGLEKKDQPCPDYVKQFGDCNSNYSNEGGNYPPSGNNPDYSNEGNNYKIPSGN